MVTMQFTPENLHAYKAYANNNQYVQRFDVTIGGVEYTMTFTFNKGELRIKNEFYSVKKLTKKDVFEHTKEDNVLKLLLTVRHIIAHYVKFNFRCLSNEVINKIVFVPALNIADKEVHLQRRNKLYIDIINDIVLLNLYTYKISYDDNKIIFEDIVSKKNKSKLMLHSF